MTLLSTEQEIQISKITKMQKRGNFNNISLDIDLSNLQNRYDFWFLPNQSTNMFVTCFH